MTIRACELPASALLRAYARNGGYTDCFATDVPGAISHARYVEAFYTTPLFRIERFILLAVKKPSTDEQARQLAMGTLNHFAAWSVEQRAENQLLLCDFMGRTRSWLMTESVAASTRLYFGSGVVPRATDTGSFNALLGFHTLYSRALLASARARLLRKG